MLKLRFTNNPQSAVWLVEPKVVLGSSATCDLVLAETGIHAQHAEILVNHEDLLFRLLSESSMTTVNNKEVEAGSTVAISVGDKLCIGAVELEVVDPKRETKKKPLLEPVLKASGWALKANHAALSNRVYPINGAITVGRSSDCEISLAAAHLSRRHAQFTFREGELFVRDLESSNGTYLNGKRVVEARVKRGDELRFDTLSFGVIGPADDLDKTSVRSVAVTHKPQVASLKKPAPVSVKTRQPPTATGRKEAMGVFASNKNKSAKPIQESIQTVRRTEASVAPVERTTGSRAAIGAGLLIIIVCGAYFAWQQFGG